MSSQVKAPDLLIYIQATIPTLVDHIHKRGRDYEGNMSLDYLKNLIKDMIPGSKVILKVLCSSLMRTN